MMGPSTEYRGEVAARLREVGSEDELDGLLAEMSIEVERDVALGNQDQPAEDVLASVEAWAGMVSYVLAFYYAPASPWPFRSAGWDKRIVARVRTTARLLQGPMQAVRAAMGAASFSISVGFPWGVSVGLSW